MSLHEPWQSLDFRDSVRASSPRGFGNIDEMAGPFNVNPARTVQTVRIGNKRNPVIVIDNILDEPDTLVEFAATAARFVVPQNWYPGLRAEPLPEPYVIEVIRALHPIIGEVFDLPTDGGVQANTYFGLATLAPEKLSLLQRLPHFDTQNPRQIALLHYLCDKSHGGTSFFRHRSTGIESIAEDGARAYFSAINAELARNGPRPARYMSGDDDMFEAAARFDAKFNRMLIYRSCFLHSADINTAMGLSSDPRIGRLTANIFLTYR